MKDKLRILNVCINIDPITGGGTGEKTVQLSRHLARYNQQVALLTLNIGITDQRKQELSGVNLIVLPCLNRRFFIPFFSLLKLNNIVKQHEIIHFISHWNFLNALIYILARINSIPYAICPAGAMTIFGRSKFLKYLYDFIIGKSLIKNARFKIAITREEVEQFLHYTYESNSIIHIPNAITKEGLKIKDDINFRKTFNLPDNPFLLFVGRLNLIKGPDLLLRAFAQTHHKYPDCHLVFAGPDEGLKEMLLEIATNMHIRNKIHILGHVNAEYKSMMYHACTALIIPSRHEAMSIVALEGAICKKPIIFTNRCGIEDFATTNSGIMVDATQESISKGLQTLLTKPESIEAMGENASFHVRQNYTWDAVIPQYIKLYRLAIFKTDLA